MKVIVRLQKADVIHPEAERKGMLPVSLTVYGLFEDSDEAFLWASEQLPNDERFFIQDVCIIEDIQK